MLIVPSAGAIKKVASPRKSDGAASVNVHLMSPNLTATGEGFASTAPHQHLLIIPSLPKDLLPTCGSLLPADSCTLRRGGQCSLEELHLACSSPSDSVPSTLSPKGGEGHPQIRLPGKCFTINMATCGLGNYNPLPYRSLSQRLTPAIQIWEDNIAIKILSHLSSDLIGRRPDSVSFSGPQFPLLTKRRLKYLLQRIGKSI